MWKYDHFMRAKGQGHMRNGVLAPGSSKQGGLSICSGLASVARVTLRCSRRMHAQPKAPRWQGTAGRHRGQIESPAAILEQHGSRNPPSQRAVPSHGTAQATTARNATNAWRSNAPRPHAGDGHARGIVHHTTPSLSFVNLWLYGRGKRESHRDKTLNQTWVPEGSRFGERTRLSACCLPRYPKSRAQKVAPVIIMRRGNRLDDVRQHYRRVR